MSEGNSDDDDIERFWLAPARELQTRRDSWIAEQKSRQSIPLNDIIDAAKSFASSVKIVLKCEVFEQRGGWKSARLPRIGNLAQKYRRGYFPTLLARVVSSMEICEPLSLFYDTSKHADYDNSMVFFRLLQTKDAPRILMLIGKEQAWQHTLQELANMTASFIEYPPIEVDTTFGTLQVDGRHQSFEQTVGDVHWWCRLIFWLIIEDKAFLSRINELQSRETVRAFVRQRFDSETLASMQAQYHDLEGRFAEYQPSPTWTAWMQAVLGFTLFELGQRIANYSTVKE